ncbi:hypothetical protein T265_08215 [Opisthorchis viverrini]|uniref:Uncharacterized protein n=1 Tax=Opisthorchis viverrini TaxID=6198 RepID=A0A074ZA89_OPIVI|nr:hypothetical protein T265_08215 [Opisthorchis viverrini]KER24048.1 hypothetical protein T265_08215 [Opisthorchis viverrini]
MGTLRRAISMVRNILRHGPVELSMAFHNSQAHHSHNFEPQMAENPVEKRFVHSSALVLLTKAFVL